MYAQAIFEDQEPLLDHVGFVDVRKTSMPSQEDEASNKERCYPGYKNVHCLSYLTMTIPDGLILYLYGPEVGRRHNMTVYRESWLDEVLHEKVTINGV